MSLNIPVSSSTRVRALILGYAHLCLHFKLDCLLVRIEDHRNTSAASQVTSDSSTGDKVLPFSIHNWNQYITPSPYVPYPLSKSSDRTVNGSSKGGLSANGVTGAASESEKENILPKEQSTETAVENTPKGPKSYTTVLFHTPLSLEEEILIFANMPDLRANNRKQSQVNGRTPASATMPHPPTPLTAVPSTPLASGPPAKKQKMMFTGKDLSILEGKLIATTAPPLCLGPVDAPPDVEILMKHLRDPLYNSDPPAPKTRKRTVAELAADEALAAEEQRFMLIMDERLVPSSTGTGAAVATDGEAGAASFEPRFERFKAIEEIKVAHQEKAQRELELKQQAAANKVRAEQQQREAQQQQIVMRREQQRREQIRALQNQQMHQNPQLLHQQGHPAGMNQHGHPPNPSGMMAAAHHIAASQAHHSSPVVRTMTPNVVSSPLVGNTMMSHGGQSVPMKVTSSGQGAGSPPRPGSAAQHAHPASSMSSQRSQQPPSRNGTPQMPNGTPRLGHATPLMLNVTPTPRLRQASPANPSMAGTPVLGPNGMAQPHMNGHQLTPQQQMYLQQQRAQQAAQFAQQQHQQNMQGSPPNNQMSNPSLQHFAAHQAHQQAQQAHRQQMQAMTQNQMSSLQANSQHAPHGMNLPQQMHGMQPHQQQHAQQQAQGGQQQAAQMAQFRKLVEGFYKRLMEQEQRQNNGPVPPNVMLDLQRQATDRARLVMKNSIQQANAAGQRPQGPGPGPTPQQLYALQQHQQQQLQAQAHQQQQMAMQNGGMQNGGMNGMNMNGMGGMGGF